MTTALASLSNEISSVVENVAPSVVQVQGHGAPVSGVIYASDAVITNARALGRDDGLRVRAHDGRAIDAELRGWDPATGLALLNVKGLDGKAAKPADEHAKVGQLAIAVARSWSNAVTASVGIVSIIGGPLRTGRRQQIEEVIRTTAPMHDGFAGGAFAGVDGKITGIATAAAIRGLGVIIPAAIAWKTAASLLEHGQVRHGYIGVSVQPIDRGLLIVGVKKGSPAEAAGLRASDVITKLESPEDLYQMLDGERIGKEITLSILRGDSVVELKVTVADRADRQ